MHRWRVSALDKEIQLISQSIESQGMAGWFSEQTNSMAQHGREAFEISKTAALAQAAINAPAAISTAFSWGSQHGGLPMGLAMGAAAAASICTNKSYRFPIIWRWQ